MNRKKYSIRIQGQTEPEIIETDGFRVGVCGELSLYVITTGVNYRNENIERVIRVFAPGHWLEINERYGHDS